MSTIQTLLEENLADAFSLDIMPEAERENFLEEVGKVVLDRTLIDYISLLDEEEQTNFETFVERNVGDVLFFSRLLTEHPTILPILESAILQFKFEVLELEEEKK